MLFVQVENVRRRHNYLPFIMELLKILAQDGKLVGLVETVRFASPLYTVFVVVLIFIYSAHNVASPLYIAFFVVLIFIYSTHKG